MSDEKENEFQRSAAEGSGRYLVRNLQTLELPALKPRQGAPNFVFKDPLSYKVRELAESVAPTNSTVLLTGESGVGKEIFARFIHYASKRSHKPFEAVNCAALAPSLLESELFGHEKGAFSGAVAQHIGVFERANSGTLLLDEVSEMPVELQAKLLRVIQEREVSRVGGTETIPVDIRIIATTNRDLEQCVRNGEFRQDLYYRLNVFPLKIPALRERPKDISSLAKYYVGHLCETLDVEEKSLSDAAIKRLEAHNYPGNIRELINVLERAVILSRDTRVLGPEHIHFGAVSAEPDAESDFDLDEDTEADDFELRFRAGDDQLTDIRRKVILATLERYGGNQTLTAQKLGVSVRTIHNKLKNYDP